MTTDLTRSWDVAIWGGYKEKQWIWRAFVHADGAIKCLSSVEGNEQKISKIMQEILV